MASFIFTVLKHKYIKRQFLEFGLFCNEQQIESMFLYMLFDRFLLAVELFDLTQAVKILIRVSSFPKLSDG